LHLSEAPAAQEQTNDSILIAVESTFNVPEISRGLSRI